ncbi:hypothetical protein ACEPAH_1441 [Sanghuangporus vaninii]
MPVPRKQVGNERKSDKIDVKRQEEADRKSLQKFYDLHRHVHEALKGLEYGFERARVTTQVLGTTHFQIKQAVKAMKGREKAAENVETSRKDLDRLDGVRKAHQRTHEEISRSEIECVEDLLSPEEAFDTAIKKLKNAPEVITKLMEMTGVAVDASLIKFSQDAREVLEAKNYEHSSTALHIWREAWQNQLEINNLYDPKKIRVLRKRFKDLQGVPNAQDHSSRLYPTNLEEVKKELKSIQAEVEEQRPSRGKLEKFKGNIKNAMLDMRNTKDTVKRPL